MVWITGWEKSPTFIPRSIHGLQTNLLNSVVVVSNTCGVTEGLFWAQVPHQHNWEAVPPWHLVHSARPPSLTFMREAPRRSIDDIVAFAGAIKRCVLGSLSGAASLDKFCPAGREWCLRYREFLVWGKNMWGSPSRPWRRQWAYERAWQLQKQHFEDGDISGPGQRATSYASSAWRGKTKAL